MNSNLNIKYLPNHILYNEYYIFYIDGIRIIRISIFYLDCNVIILDS